MVDAELMSMSDAGDTFLDALMEMTIKDAQAEMQRVIDEWDRKLFSRVILEYSEEDK